MRLLAAASAGASGRAAKARTASSAFGNSPHIGRAAITASASCALAPRSRR